MGCAKSIVLAGLLMGLTGSQFIALPAVAQETIAQNRAPNLEAAKFMSQGFEAFEQAKYEATIAAFKQALVIYQTDPDPHAQRLAVWGIGMSYDFLGQYQNAIEFYEKNVALTRQLKDRKLEASAVYHLLSPHNSLGNYSKALEYGQQSLAIAREAKDESTERYALMAMGAVYNKLGNPKKAMEHHQQVLPLAQAQNDRAMIAGIYGNMGTSYRLLGNYPQALTIQKQALALFRELKNRTGEQIALTNLGNISFSLKQYREAIAYQEQSLKISQAINDRATQAQSLINIAANHHALGEHAKAIEVAEKALPIAREIKDVHSEGSALSNIGGGYLRMGRLAEAEKALRSSATLLESLRVGLTDPNKVALSETQTFLYEYLQETLVQQKRPEAALEVAERGRARAFIELLASRLQNKSQTELQTLAESPNLDQIRQIAKAQNATLVEYSFVDEKKLLYIWVIKPTGEIQFKTSKLEAMVPLSHLIQQTRSSIAITGDNASETEVPDDLHLALRSLHQSLIEPIASALPTDPNQRVIFLPQGSLFLVPFAALRDAKGKYLIENHTISTAPSIHTLALTQEKAKRSVRNGNILVVGDPTMPQIPGMKLENLPGARAEAIAIAQLLKTTPLIGNQATKAAVLQQMNQASIIHLATHGLLGTFKGEIPGAIILAPNGADNGFLTSSEIFDLKINPDLLVLSACDTGGGDITGDGVIGLSRSFIAAGAPSLLVSLWAVNDASTSVLMQSFYQTLKTNPNKAQALRSSMLSTMKQYPNPRYWAAFTLVGET